MATDFDFLQVQALAGGHVFVVDSPEGLELAAAWGVGIILADDRLLQDREFNLSVEEKGLRPFFDARTSRETVEFFEKCNAPIPFTLVDIEELPDQDLGRTFLRVQDASRCGPQLLRAAAIVTSNKEVIDAVKSLRNHQKLTPIFAEANSPEEALELFHCGVDGSILRFTPSDESMKELALQMIAAIEQLPASSNPDLTVGVLSLQGEYRLQARRFEEAASVVGSGDRTIDIQFVRNSGDLSRCQAIVLVGGWSNVQTQLLQATSLVGPINSFHRSGGYILGLCAGMILCRKYDGPFCENRKALGFIDVEIHNNKLNGPQRVKVTESVPERYRSKPDGWIPMEHQPVFSDGPVVTRYDKGVVPLAETAGGELVAAGQGNVMVMAYHNGPTVHEMFLEFALGVWSLGGDTLGDGD